MKLIFYCAVSLVELWKWTCSDLLGPYPCHKFHLSFPSLYQFQSLISTTIASGSAAMSLFVWAMAEVSSAFRILVPSIFFFITGFWPFHHETNIFWPSLENVILLHYQITISWFYASTWCARLSFWKRFYFLMHQRRVSSFMVFNTLIFLIYPW